MTGIVGKVLALVLIYPNPFILQKIASRMGYDKDGNPTGEQAGYTLTLIETDNFNKVKVKIPMNKLPITQEQLDDLKNQNKRVFVKVIDGEIKPYYSSTTKTIEDSISAKGFEVVDGKL